MWITEEIKWVYYIYNPIAQEGFLIPSEGFPVSEGT